MQIHRIEGETVCADCPRPACYQLTASRASATDHSQIVTGVLALCDTCAGSLRYQLMIRAWDMENDRKWRLHGIGPRWHKFWDGIEPEPEEPPAKTKVA